MVGETRSRANPPDAGKQGDRGSSGSGAYNLRPRTIAAESLAMEAEQLNQIASQLVELRDREAQLRRYL